MITYLRSWINCILSPFFFLTKNSVYREVSGDARYSRTSSYQDLNFLPLLQRKVEEPSSLLLTGIKDLDKIILRNLDLPGLLRFRETSKAARDLVDNLLGEPAFVSKRVAFETAKGLEKQKREAAYFEDCSPSV